MLLVGFVLLIKGADYFVEGSSALARKLRVPTLIIGLTIVAMGTSLPELVTSVTAAKKNELDMAVGNVVGSNVFNILMILGAASTLNPISFIMENVVDIAILLGFSVLVWVMCLTRKRLSKAEGSVMLLAYAAFTAYMDDKFTNDEMEEKIHARFPDPKTTQIVCRCGSITDVADLQICSLDTCMSVIVNAESDATTLKCILVVTRMLKECGNDKAYITAVIRDEQNKETAELAGEGYVEVLSFQDVISRIIAHSGRYAGLSHVYTDLFDMDGSEFYIEEHPAAGKTLSELNRYFPESIVCGFVTGEGKILLNPAPDYRAAEDDRVILFAEDDGTSKMDPEMAPVMEDVIRKDYVKEPLEQVEMLILGCNSKLPRILREEDNYVAAGSKVTIALSGDQMGRKAEIEKLQMSNIEISIVECDFYDRRQLKALVKPGLSVLVLADDNEEDDDETVEKKDAKILMILLQLRYLSEVEGYKLNITSEMLRVENQELAQFANVNDFVVSSNITSLIVTQICQSRELRRIFEELLRAEGSEIYVRPAGNYLKLGVKTNIYTACEAAARQQEVMIGYRRYDRETGAVEMINNPPKAQEIVFEETDGFVVIAVD